MQGTKETDKLFLSAPQGADGDIRTYKHTQWVSQSVREWQSADCGSQFEEFSPQTAAERAHLEFEHVSLFGR